MILLVALGVLFSCVQTNFAQVRTGGYKQIPITDTGAVAAAEYAVNAQSEKEELEITLDTVVKAERQVVAGTNYKLCLQTFVLNPDEEVEEVEERFVQAVIFKSLKNEYTIKSWVETESCGE